MQYKAPEKNRRDVLVTGLSAALIAGCAPKRTWQPTKVDVVVIGGGISGLSAALTLASEGVDVQVVEANTRLGGRCYTLKTQDGAFDCGATTIGPYYGRLRSFVLDAGVPLKAPPGRDKFSYNINGQFVSPDQWEGSSANLMQGEERAILPERLEFPIVMKHNQIKDLTAWRSEEMLKYDVPLSSYLLQKGVSQEALRLINITSNTMDLAQTSALFQMREFTRLAMPQSGDKAREVYAAGKDGSYHYVKGGTSALIDGMASRLNVEPMMGDRVVAIDVASDAATVTLASGKFIQAKSVICTAPYSVLRSIAITPALDGPKKAAVDQSVYTLTTHVIYLPTKPYWERDGHPAGLISDDVVERVMANYDDDGKVAWLDVWLNGAAAAQMDQMPERDMIAFVTKRLGLLRPAMAGAIEPVGVYSWGNNPYIRGNKYIMRPGDAKTMYPWLAAPHKRRLQFAGEHTRDFEAGLEAAAATGIREAVNYLDQFA